jgi:hypothetical protein
MVWHFRQKPCFQWRLAALLAIAVVGIGCRQQASQPDASPSHGDKAAVAAKGQWPANFHPPLDIHIEKPPVPEQIERPAKLSPGDKKTS